MIRPLEMPGKNKLVFGHAEAADNAVFEGRGSYHAEAAEERGG